MKSRRNLLLAGVTVLSLALPIAWARWGIVITQDGKQYSGDITESPNEVRIVDKGITQIVARDQVKDILWQPSVDEIYKQKAKQLRDNDAEGYYRLAEWCRGQDRYDLVKQAADKVLKNNPKHENAKLLADLATRKLQEQAATSQPADSIDDTADDDGKIKLTDSDIQKLRFLEYRLTAIEERARVEFARNFTKKFLEEMSGEPEFGSRFQKNMFERAQPSEKLKQIIQISERKFSTPSKYVGDVKIVDDPWVFQEFKSRLLPPILNSCATSACHGGKNARKYRLINETVIRPQTLYTNFLILDAVKTPEGRMIDRDKPEQSLILQFNLPPELSSYRHPEVTSPFNPLFRNREDPAYQRMLNWIGMLRVPRPNYGLQAKGIEKAADLKEAKKPAKASQ